MDNQEFFALLEQTKVQETFDTTLTDGKTIKCKPLTALHLKDLVESVVDSPLTQSLFATTINKIFKQSITNEIPYQSLNYIDKVIFAVSTKIASLSPQYKFTHDEEEHSIDLNDVKSKLLAALGSNHSLFQQQTFSSNNCTITYGIPFLFVEDQLNNEVHKNSKVEDNIQTQEQLRKALGDAFIHEIAKTINSVEISGTILDFSTINFKTRLKTIESLPASLLGKIIKHIEQYKKVLDDALTVSLSANKTYLIPIDGSLFTTY